MVQSARGGLHLYYLYDASRMKHWGSPTGLKGNLDIRSDGCGLVGPGSKTENGTYEIVCNKPISSMPHQTNSFG